MVLKLPDSWPNSSFLVEMTLTSRFPFCTSCMASFRLWIGRDRWLLIFAATATQSIRLAAVMTISTLYMDFVVSAVNTFGRRKTL